MFRLKAWNLFTNVESLWVSWLKSNVFHQKPLWMMEDSPRLSKSVRSLVQLKDFLITFMRCEIGDGQDALFWFDSWTELGPLLTYVGDSGPRRLRLRVSATVADATRNGTWNLP